MGKLPEKLSILLGVGDTILARLHKVKAVVTNPQRRPVCLTDPQSIKLLNGCLKKFKDPDVCFVSEGVLLFICVLGSEFG